MKNKGVVELWVGFFILLGIAGLVFLAFQVSGLTQSSMSHGYVMKADFDNVGGLKVRAPVQIGGVVVGRVTNIELDAKTYKAIATMLIYDTYSIPTDSTASILTQGLLGSNYLGITPGYAPTNYKAGDTIERTNSALILEQLIGQFLFNVNK
ncbi:MAG: outer membrane lipid asymmetry maintenance protein MlaD [Gammaproteobacteria bacterium]|nr:outer membrane lipid asymmetry maintenance protein MlaD [Gammaproteobacteria bacterium]